MNGKPLHVLLVDDEEIVHETVGRFLKNLGHKVESAHDGLEGLDLIEKNDYNLALVDLKMPGLDGMNLLNKAQKSKPELSMVIITGHGNMDLAIQALRFGAADFLTKPIKLLELEAVLEKAARYHRLKSKQNRLKIALSSIQATEDSRRRGRRMIAVSPQMKMVQKQIQDAVEANVDTIMITGETGTGKEVVAREIHFRGDHSDQRPFIPVSCPAIPDTLVESELFGHVKGTFTGAVADKAGCFEIADGGTLFLDEVADLSRGAQAKMLRVLETRSVRRVGGSKEVEVNVRVVAATNSPLDKLVEERKFRQDLFYRLNVFTINIEPLRNRPEDITPLADYFLDLFAAKSNLGVKGFSKNAQKLLKQYPYTGNARELRNIVERSAILCKEGKIQPEHLNLPTINLNNSKTPKYNNVDNEYNTIMQALEKAKWNRKQAAEELGMPYSSFRYKLKKYEIA